MFKSFHITTAYGIPIRLHWSLYFAVPLVMLNTIPASQWLLWLFIIAGLMFSVALHEIGHSILALRKGIRVEDIVLTPIGGIAKLAGMPEESGDEMQIAIAGPLVSVALALFFGLLTYLVGLWGDRFLFTLCFNLFALNTMLVLFNLIPAFPMDGGRIFRAWMTPKKGRVHATRIASNIGRYLAILGGLWGLFGNGPFALVFIAVFIYIAAGSEYRMVLLQEQYNRMNNPFGTSTPPVAEGFSVSPPPYVKNSSPIMRFSLLRETAAAYRVLQYEFISFIRRAFSAQ